MLIIFNFVPILKDLNFSVNMSIPKLMRTRKRKKRKKIRMRNLQKIPMPLGSLMGKSVRGFMREYITLSLVRYIWPLMVDIVHLLI